MYKSSSYNFIIDLADSGDKLVYNSFSNRLGVMNAEHVQLLNLPEIDPSKLSDEDRSMLPTLIKDGMVLNQDKDELSVLRFMNDSHKYSKEVMGLTIVPTKNCNFRCTYCYQERDTFPNMTEKVQQAILQYVSEAVKKLKELHITWFGGEPLLNKKLVMDLSREIQKITSANDCICTFSIITNGYLIDDSLVTLFSQLNFKMVQITLDGPPRIHNARKGFSENGGDCFSRIVKNLKKLAANNIKTAVRINIDRTNQDAIEELLDILVAEDLKIPGIYAAQVYPYTEACKSVENNVINDAEFSRCSYDLYQMMATKGFDVDLSKLFPQKKAHYCCADQINSFIIDPEGEMYKCYSDFERKSSSLGSVIGYKDSRLDKQKHAEWLTRSPFDSETCRVCKLLPLCMGGCAYLAMKNGDKNRHCGIKEEQVIKMVTDYYKLVELKALCKRIAAVI